MSLIFNFLNFCLSLRASIFFCFCFSASIFLSFLLSKGQFGLSLSLSTINMHYSRLVILSLITSVIAYGRWQGPWSDGYGDITDSADGQYSPATQTQEQDGQYTPPAPVPQQGTQGGPPGNDTTTSALAGFQTGLEAPSVQTGLLATGTQTDLGATGIQTAAATDAPTGGATAGGSEGEGTSTATASTPGTTDSGSTGGQYTGEITHYSPSDGTGSCGKTFADTDLVCALSTEMMANGANPNNNPKCHQSITLTNPNNPGSWKAQIVSTCEGCAYADVDLSPTLFSMVAPDGDGRVSRISWSFD